MDKVSVIRCESYDPERLDAVIERHFSLLDPDSRLIKQGNRVAIKPNLVMKRRPEEATTTHPAFIAAIIRAVKRRGGVPIIAESPGGPYTKSALKVIYASTGITAIAEKEGAELNYDTTSKPLMVNKGRICASFDIISPIADADVIISAAKLKTHGQMIYSGAVKNMFGVIPGLAKPEFHYRYPNPNDFGHMLVDLCETVRPVISFTDGIVGMEGNGPTGGSPKELGLTLAGLNPYALDVYTCSLIGLNANESPILAAASERGLCPADISGIEVIGEGTHAKRVKFKMPASKPLEFTANYPAFLRNIVVRLFTPRPVIRNKDCIGCGKCAESCPQKIIKITNHKAVINYDSCIKCFCCHEMCPRRAIDIKRFALLKG